MAAKKQASSTSAALSNPGKRKTLRAEVHMGDDDLLLDMGEDLVANNDDEGTERTDRTDRLADPDDGVDAAYALAEEDDDAVDDLSDLNDRQIEALDPVGEGSDPVRMYLREISKSPLLTADQELAICATFGAFTAIKKLEAVGAVKGQTIWQDVYEHLALNWQKSLASAQALTVDQPSLEQLLNQARALPFIYTETRPGYFLQYLRPLGLGSNPDMETLSEPMYQVVVATIILPGAFVDSLVEFVGVGSTTTLPEWDEARTWLIDDESDAVARRKVLEQIAEEARQALAKSNLRLVVSIAKRYMGRGIALLNLKPRHALNFSAARNNPMLPS